jgi:hypothetical protein
MNQEFFNARQAFARLNQNVAKKRNGCNLFLKAVK